MDTVVVRPKPIPRKNLPKCVLEGEGEGEEVKRKNGVVEQEEHESDLRIELVERDKVVVKSDAYIRYRICTKVRLEWVWFWAELNICSVYFFLVVVVPAR